MLVYLFSLAVYSSYCKYSKAGLPHTVVNFLFILAAAAATRGVHMQSGVYLYSGSSTRFTLYSMKYILPVFVSIVMVKIS